MSYTPILFVPAQALGADRETIESVTADLAVETSLDRSDFHWLEKTIMGMGGRIETGGGGALALETLDASRFTIFDAGLMASVEQNRVRSAALLGHHVLHGPGAMEDHPEYGMRVPRDPDHPHAPPETARREAIHFATGLLMPEREFRDAWNEGGPDRCQFLFRTPGRWITARAAQLDLATPDAPAAEGP